MSATEYNSDLGVMSKARSGGRGCCVPAISLMAISDILQLPAAVPSWKRFTLKQEYDPCHPQPWKTVEQIVDMVRRSAESVIQRLKLSLFVSSTGRKGDDPNSQQMPSSAHPTVPDPIPSMPTVTPVMWQDAFTNAYVSGHGNKRYREESLDHIPYDQYSKRRG